VLRLSSDQLTTHFITQNLICRCQLLLPPAHLVHNCLLHLIRALLLKEKVARRLHCTNGTLLTLLQLFGKLLWLLQIFHFSLRLHRQLLTSLTPVLYDALLVPNIQEINLCALRKADMTSCKASFYDRIRFLVVPLTIMELFVLGLSDVLEYIAS
jgi:hypothetical protein